MSRHLENPRRFRLHPLDGFTAVVVTLGHDRAAHRGGSGSANDPLLACKPPNRQFFHGFARRRGLQPADCEEVTQGVSLSLSKAMPDFQYDAGKGKFRPYLKTATLHAIFEIK
ncbi:MAG: hypothetical protein JSV91_03740 [Phycisphaerales bacterium]|nr:MAG: hypothetical protein JSV91_03740 [Phycisphaerales bacterium]